jgi:hypothetical protein
MYTPTQAAELETLGRNCSNLRLSEILQALDAGFTYAEIAELGDTTESNVRARRNEWAHVLQGRVPTGPDHARNVALALRHLLASGHMSPGLRGAVMAHLSELAKINREISVTSPVGTRQLRTLGQGKAEEPRWPSTCSRCFTQHAGDCA